MSKGRTRSWQIAADLEAAAKAVREAELAIVNCDESVWSEINRIAGIDFLGPTANLLQALSDKYQAIADAEPEIADALLSGIRGTVCQRCGKAGLLMCSHGDIGEGA